MPFCCGKRAAGICVVLGPKQSRLATAFMNSPGQQGARLAFVERPSEKG